MTLKRGRQTSKPEILVVALSNGAITMYELKLDDHPNLQHVVTFNYFPQATLVLSLAMSPTHTSTVATLSTGHVAIIDDGRVSAEPWKAHDLEVWCSAWKSDYTILTGGDDSLLKLWDLRSDLQTVQSVSKWSLRPLTLTSRSILTSVVIMQE
jgi:WD40 repeat protein